jgi:hypothetical protein
MFCHPCLSARGRRVRACGNRATAIMASSFTQGQPTSTRLESRQLSQEPTLEIVRRGEGGCEMLT